MLTVATLAAALIALAPPGASSMPPPGIIDGATAQQLQQRGVTVVDVRSAGEFESGHVPGAINVPYDQVAARSAEVGAKGKPVLLYCRSGRRSGIAAAELNKQGFSAVYDFKSIQAWPGPVEKGPAPSK
jgi:rhodanese-related sulfurtransferase